MSKIDIDKFICSMAERKVLNPIIIRCLKDQGLEYRDGEIYHICEEEVKLEEGKWYVFTHASLHYDTINGEVTFEKNKPYKAISESTLLGDGGDYCFRGQEDMLKNLRPVTEEEIKEAESKPTTIKFEDDNPQTLDEISKNGYIDMGRPIELTIPKEKKRYFSDIYDDKDEFRNKVKELIHSGESAYLDDSFWGKEEVEKLMKETNEGSKKIMEQMRKIVFAKDPDIDTMVEKFAESKGGIFGAERDAYRKGLEDMYRLLKGE